MKNWDYDLTRHISHPHAIVFNRCRDTGVHAYKSCSRSGTVRWLLNPDVVDWLTQQFDSSGWTYDPLVPYAVNFRNKAHAMLFKLTFSNGIR